ncbi:hypothetical protein BDP27DRAFT_1439511 [Rhodocollybia butyracea]|uniref:Uncharacterized protein n=1 Tax=Rhodocollybia butyracea TaxID=206335 RepID=A0A9P5P5H7_9AGAR|nr:hypothetical protein BDP27DRAFT_1439511 [Rhodocollybia butyracea]
MPGGTYLDLDGLFKELDLFGHTAALDVVEAFLNSAVDAETDPIKYHASRLDKPGAKITPRRAFARMGLDYLTAPGDYFCTTFYFFFDLDSKPLAT